MMFRGMFEVCLVTLMVAISSGRRLVTTATEIPVNIAANSSGRTTVADQAVGNSDSSIAKFLFLDDPNVVELKSFEDWLAALHGIYLGPGGLFDDFVDNFYATQSNNTTDKSLAPPGERLSYFSDLLSSAATAPAEGRSANDEGSFNISYSVQSTRESNSDSGGVGFRENPLGVTFSIGSALSRSRVNFPFHSDTISKIRGVFQNISGNSTEAFHQQQEAPENTLQVAVQPGGSGSSKFGEYDSAELPEVAIVMYYAIWCPHCHRRAPSFSSLASQLRCAKRVKFFAFECSQSTNNRVGHGGVTPSAVCGHADATSYPRFGIYWRYQRFPEASGQKFFVPSPFEPQPVLLSGSSYRGESVTSQVLPRGTETPSTEVKSDSDRSRNVQWLFDKNNLVEPPKHQTILPVRASANSKTIELVFSSIKFSAQRKPSSLKYDLLNAWPLPSHWLVACPGQERIEDDFDLAWAVPEIFDLPLPAVIAKASSSSAWELPVNYNRPGPSISDAAAFELVSERWPSYPNGKSDSCPDTHLHDALQGLVFLLRNWVPMSLSTAETPILLEPLQHLITAASTYLPGRNIRKALREFWSRVAAAAVTRLKPDITSPGEDGRAPGVIGKEAYHTALDSLELGGLKPGGIGDNPQFVVAKQLSSSLWLLFETLAAGTVVRLHPASAHRAGLPVGVVPQSMQSGAAAPTHSGVVDTKGTSEYVRCSADVELAEASSAPGATSPPDRYAAAAGIGSDSFLARAQISRVTKASRDEEMADDGPQVTPEFVAKAIQVTVATYFGCESCRDHFQYGFNRCLGGRCDWVRDGMEKLHLERSDAPTSDGLLSPSVSLSPAVAVALKSSQGVVRNAAVGLLMWIWRFHNMITVRTAVEHNSDAIIAFLEQQAKQILKARHGNIETTEQEATSNIGTAEMQTFFPREFYKVGSEVRYPSPLQCPRCYASSTNSATEHGDSGVFSQKLLERAIAWQRKVKGLFGHRLVSLSNATELEHEEFDHYEEFRLDEVFRYLMQVYWRSNWQENSVLVWNLTKMQFDVSLEVPSATAAQTRVEQGNEAWMSLRFEKQPGGFDELNERQSAEAEATPVESRILKGEKVIDNRIVAAAGAMLTVKSGHTNVILLLAALVTSAIFNFFCVRSGVRLAPAVSSNWGSSSTTCDPPTGRIPAWSRQPGWGQRLGSMIAPTRWLVGSWLARPVKSLDHISPPRGLWVDAGEVSDCVRPNGHPVGHSSMIRGRKVPTLASSMPSPQLEPSVSGCAGVVNAATVLSGQQLDVATIGNINGDGWKLRSCSGSGAIVGSNGSYTGVVSPFFDWSTHSASSSGMSSNSSSSVTGCGIHPSTYSTRYCGPFVAATMAPEEEKNNNNNNNEMMVVALD